MRRRILTALAVCLCLLAAGCRQGLGVRCAKLRIETPVGGSKAKTIAPEGALDVCGFILDGKGPDGNVLDSLRSPTGRFEVRNLLCGEWRFEAAALNAKGNRIAHGRRTVAIEPETTSVTVPLDEIPGIGRLELDFQVKGEFSLENNAAARLVIEIYHRDTDARNIYEKPLKGKARKARLAVEALRAGSYQVSATLYRNNDILGSAVEAVRIVENTLTKGHMIVTADDEKEVKKVQSIIGVSAPVTGTIVVQKRREGAQEPFYILTFAPDPGFASENLSYQWYEGGVPIPDANMRTCEARPDKTTSYTLFVYSDKPGSDASFDLPLEPVTKIGGGGGANPPHQEQKGI